MSTDAKNIPARIGGILGASVSIVVAAVFLGMLSRITWAGFSWGWSLFGL